MTIFDQFETEPRGAFSGSYLAEVYLGEPGTEGFTESNNARGLVTSKLNPNASEYLDQAFLPFWLTEGYASGSYTGRIQRFKRHVTVKETYFDSIAPNPLDIHLSTTQFLAWCGDALPVTGGVRWGIRDVAGSNETVGGGFLVHLWLPDAKTTSYVNDIAVDHEWHANYPFISKYKGIERLIDFKGIFPKKYETAIDLLSGGTITPISQANFVGGAGYSLTVPGFSSVGNLVVLSTLQVPNLPYPIYYNVPPARRGTITPYIYFKLFFGFGDGDKFFGNYSKPGIPLLGSEGTGPEFLNAEWIPLIRGFKYGLFNSNPIRSSCVFRQGRFGQMRDMLEQRVYTKFLDSEKGNSTTQAAVNIKFTSGTLTHARSVDYLSASSPSYNPTDSGQFDFEYKSGQPFHDDFDLTAVR